jgi:hypothetical protein
MKMSRVFSVSVIACLMVGLGYQAYETFWGPDRLVLEGMSLAGLLTNGEVQKFLGFSAMLVLFGVFELRDLMQAPPAEIKDGVAAGARVLRVRDTGVSVNDDPQVELLLEVTPPGGGASFQAEGKIFVPRLQAAMARPGILAEVEFDPKNPKRLKITALSLPEPPAGGSAGRLAQLEALRKKGLISDEEFRHKQKEIQGKQ